MNRTVSKKFGFITVLLTIVLVFGLTPSLAAQSTLSWGKRSLVGMSYRNSYININNVKFGALQGGGDPNVVIVRTQYDNKSDKFKAFQNSKDPNVVEVLPGGWVTVKTTVNRIKDTKVNGIEKNSIYTIKLTGNHLLEVSGTYTESGLTGQVFYVIKGPTELSLGFLGNWPNNVKIDVSPDYETMIYYDQALFNRTITEQFVDKYIVPVVNYGEMRKMYDATKKKFTDHVDGGKDKADKEKRSKECPESIACTCRGDTAQHIIYSAAMGQGLLGAAIGTLPLVIGAPAEAAAESGKTKKSAVLAATLGYHYGWYKDERTFKNRFRDDAIILFSGADIPNAGAAAAGAVKEEVITNSSGWFIKKLAPKSLSAIPGIGPVVGFAIGGITNAIDMRNIGNRAVKFFRR